MEVYYRLLDKAAQCYYLNHHKQSKIHHSPLSQSTIQPPLQGKKLKEYSLYQPQYSIHFAYNNWMISKIEDKLGLQLINILLHLVLANRIFPQIQLLQMGQVSTREQVQTHLAQLIPSQHQRLYLIASDEVDEEGHLLVTQPHIDQLHCGDMRKIEQGKQGLKINIPQLVRNQLPSPILHHCLLIGLLDVGTHDPLQRLRLVPPLQRRLQPTLQLLLPHLRMFGIELAGDIGTACPRFLNRLLRIATQVELGDVHEVVPELPLYLRMLVCVTLYRVVIVVKLILLQEPRLVQTPPEILQLIEFLEALHPRHGFPDLLDLADVEDAALMRLPELEIILHLVHELALRVGLLQLEVHLGPGGVPIVLGGDLLLLFVYRSLLPLLDDLVQTVPFLRVLLVVAAQVVEVVDEALGVELLLLLVPGQPQSVAVSVDGEDLEASQDVLLQAVLAGVDAFLHQVLPRHPIQAKIAANLNCIGNQEVHY